MRVTSHGSVSPNSHGRVAPEKSPAAPARRASRADPRRESVGRVLEQAAPELADRLGGQAKRPVGGPAQQSRGAQRALELRERPRVGGSLAPELAGERVEVDVVESGARVTLGQLLGEGVEIGDVLEGPGAVAEPEPLLAGEVLGPAPLLAGAQCAQVVVHPAQLAHEIRRAEGLLRELVELLALGGGERVAEARRRGGPLGEGVDEFIDALRILGEELPVLVHELLELRVGVLPEPVRLEEGVEVAQHRLDRGPILVRGALHRLLHPREPLVEHLPAEQVLDLLVRLPAVGAAPRIVGQLAHRRGRRVRQPLDPHLGEARVVVEVARELLALGEHRLVEQLADLLERPVEAVVLQQLPAPLRHATPEVVESALVPAAAAEELAQRALRGRAGHDVLTDRRERLAEVDRRREGIRAARVRPVAGVSPGAGHQP